MEINFDKRHGGGRPKGVEAAGKGAGKEPVFCWSFQSDFTSEITDCTQQQKTGSQSVRK